MSLFVIAFVCGITAAVLSHTQGRARRKAQGVCRKERGRPKGGLGESKRSRGPPPCIYDTFPTSGVQAGFIRTKQRELKENGEIGHRNCKEEDPKVCKLRDMEKVRCAMTDEPSQECTDEILAYIQGDICNEDGAETDD
ncbi:uncharacterized protein LOC129989025 isoform X2 [Argiope bruennichi]|uniref:uncharacterized protein LOC129989025 isoform X2 n=1 Tax=Argiope bruennichi TaxID=94029 RepID=UPI002493F8C0|nr:uncharacterized protein LOC129989025 isoform X2 [Argiope bruennichi]